MLTTLYMASAEGGGWEAHVAAFLMVKELLVRETMISLMKMASSQCYSYKYEAIQTFRNAFVAV